MSEAPTKRAFSSLTEVFRTAGRPLLIPYTVGGFPDIEGCKATLETYLDSGADLIEIGIPFSDPLADGPVIQGASQTALRQGVRPTDVLRLAGWAAGQGAKVILLCYLNPILAFGLERFFACCQEEGVLGVVVPDLPVEEADEVQSEAQTHGVDVILLAAPTSTESRLARIGRAASGFIYCVSTTGVTGARDQLRADLASFVARVRTHTNLPLAVGFGVSTPEQAEQVAKLADGVIIGSALVSLLAQGGSLEEGLGAVRSLLQEVKRMPSFSKNSFRT